MSSWERTWVINRNRNVYSCKVPLELDLKRKAAKGITFYEVRFKNNDSPDEWNDCWLVPRGTRPCMWHDAHSRLPPWNPSHEQKYQDGILKQLEVMNASINRLEGQLDYGNFAKMVYFFMVHKAIKDPVTKKLSDLLIVVTTSNLPWNFDGDDESKKPAPVVNKVVADEDGDVEGAADPVNDEFDPIEDGTAHGNPK